MITSNLPFIYKLYKLIQEVNSSSLRAVFVFSLQPNTYEL